jgi:hypothetical protein
MKTAESAIITSTIAAVGDHAIGNADGSLREIRTTDISGREIVEFGGSPLSWMRTFMAPAKCVTRFRNPVTGETLRPARRSI